MNFQNKLNFDRITAALDYLQTNYRAQPELEEIAKAVHMSPFHFQRLFTDWVGVSPKKFLQFTTLSYAKFLLKEKQATLFETSEDLGLSATSRLHDLFIQIEGMSPATYKNGGKNLSINYSFTTSPFGDILVASTPVGICFLAFVEHKEDSFLELQSIFPQAKFNLQVDFHQQNALAIFKGDWQNIPQIKLHLKGTAFQLHVWQSLLKIPMGSLSTYGQIAAQIDNSNASRAVGSAIGNNPIAYLIPCHRVIQSSGLISGYRWGVLRKKAMIGWEAAKTSFL